MGTTSKKQRTPPMAKPAIGKKNLQPSPEKTPFKQKAVDADPKRLWLFRLFAFFLPFVFFFLLEITLRAINYGGTLDLFISAPADYADYYMCNPQVGKRYFFMQSVIPDPPNDIFLKKKPRNGYRIFVLGESTTAGYPYGNNLMFSRILHKRVQDVFPDRQVEVINTAMSAVNSFAMLDYMQEILAQQPDAILIYAGHNEFYGALGVASTETLGKFHGVVKLYLKLQRFKTFLLLRDLIAKARNGLALFLGEESASDPSGTLMERMVSEQTIPFGSSLYEMGKRQFETNLRDIFIQARAAKIPVIVSEIVSNIRDHKPFVSVTADTLPAADQVYRYAQKLEHESKWQEAKAAYYRAKDLDALRFRATEDFNQLIHRVAADHQIPVVPMKSYFEKASPQELIGNTLMLEHLHPNAEGYFIMAEGFFDAMQSNQFIAAAWDSTLIQPAKHYHATWGYTPLDSAYAALRIRILKGGWPFHSKAAPNRALMDYHPATKAESLAVKIWTKDSDLEHGHVEMAEYYERRREYDKAFQEYNALICATPMNSSPYLKAANVLILRQRYPEALQFLYASQKLEDSPFANKWIGQILLNEGKINEGLSYLEKAVQQAPNDPQLLFNLSGGYALDAKYQKALELLARLDQINPNFPGAADLKAQLNSLKP
ncbi:MAG: GDSL-type esterase/lipase family protein [bacterium]